MRCGQGLATASRVALVIGVGDYDENVFFRRPNARRDAEKIVDVLIEQGGFEEANVLLCRDPTRDDLIDALENFKALVDEHKGCIALLFYSGDKVPCTSV